jgi:hypothetical protein
VSPVRYELGFYIPEDGILHSHRRENLKSYINILKGLKQSVYYPHTVSMFCLRVVMPSQRILRFLHFLFLLLIPSAISLSLFVVS